MSRKREPDDTSDVRFADLIGVTKDISRGPALAKAPSSKPRTPNTRSEKQTAGPFRFPDPSEARLGAAVGVNDAQLFALRRGDHRPEERIDLHGLRREAAGRLITTRIESARARGLGCVAVIHGRGQGSEAGEAVLRDSVPDWLSKAHCAPHVLAFAPAPGPLGGEGATLVLLRRTR